MKLYRARKSSIVLLTGLVLFILTGSLFGQNMFRKMNDFDGDGKTDFAVTRREGNSKIWYVWQSRDGFKAFEWGIYSDSDAAGDYDGDGKTDFAIWRGQNFPDPILIPRFWIWNSGSNSASQEDFPDAFRVNGRVQQDYNGDGKTDPAIWIGNIQEPPGSGATSISVRYSGTPGSAEFYIPPYSSPVRVGDLTGDGRADNVYRTFSPSPFTVNITNSATGATGSIQFGLPSDQYVRADFDGDGIGELAIWRSSDGNWWWIRSSDNTVRAVNWGTSGDIPVPGDYDGDGKTDLAIWRTVSGQGYYWIYGSQNGNITVFPWGLSTDAVLQP